MSRGPLKCHILIVLFAKTSHETMVRFTVSRIGPFPHDKRSGIIIIIADSVGWFRIL